MPAPTALVSRDLTSSTGAGRDRQLAIPASHSLDALERLEPPSPFQTRPWLESWIQHRGKNLEPLVLVANNGETVAPLGISRKRGIRTIEFLGTGDSDQLGMLTALDQAAAWDSVIRELATIRRDWDVLHFHSVLHRDAILHAAKQHLGVRAVDREYERCPVVDINGSWEQFLTSHKKLRYEVRRWSKRLAEMGTLSTEEVALPLDDVQISELEAVERASWKWERGNASLMKGPQRDFLTSVLKDARMPASVWMLRVSGELAAYAIVLRDASAWHYYMTTYRREYKNAGSHLLGEIAKAAFDRKLQSLQLLRGDHEYKALWASSSYPVYEIMIPSGVRGRIAASLMQVRWRAARSRTLNEIRSRLVNVGDRR